MILLKKNNYNKNIKHQFDFVTTNKIWKESFMIFVLVNHLIKKEKTKK